MFDKPPIGFKPMTFGEETKESISKGKPVLAFTKCVFCDHEVWVSSIGYSAEDPNIDIKLPPTKNRLNVHKKCVFFIFDLIMPAIMQNLKNRGQL